MAQVGLLFNELKRRLKAKSLTYAELARKLKLSESSVKRMFSRQTLSVRRLEQICHLLEVEISDVVDTMHERREYLTELTPEQETALLADVRLLLVMYLLINGWRVEEITRAYDIEERDAERLLIRLHRAKIIELQPFNRVKLLTARNFSWRKNGPVQTFFENEVQPEFLDADFPAVGGTHRFVGGTLSRASLTQMQQSVERLAREFDEMSRRDSALPHAERSSCCAVFAVRPWEYSGFSRLKRGRKPVAAADPATATPAAPASGSRR